MHELTVAAVDTRIARINARPGRVAYDDAAECRLEVLGEPERQLSRRRVHGAADRRARMVEESMRARRRGREQRQHRDEDTTHDHSPPGLLAATAGLVSGRPIEFGNMSSG